MIELLAPVGSIEAFYAAINNKADAIYLGGMKFGARAYANNFDNEKLKEIIKTAHLFNVKVYVTVNTVIFDEEIPELIEFLDFLYLNDCDAIIIQDLGVLNLVRNRYPDFEIHASTQMNIHSVEEARTLKDLGVKRIVVAREIDLELIKKIKEEVGIEIEVFVHGALCISSSGKCYMSSIIGRRSGNRGRCAQPCRLQYKLKDEEGYLISPKDLYSLPRINELIEAGVDSLKVEGRMKRPEYVAQIVQSCRKAIDTTVRGQEFDLEKEELNLRKIFNRDFTKGYLFNETDDNLINKNASNHQGVEIGEVVYSKSKQVKIKLTSSLVKGDSVRIVGKKQDAITVNQMYLGKRLVDSAKAGEIVTLPSHIDGLTNSQVFLTTSQNQITELSKTTNEITRKIQITGVVKVVDDYLTLELNYNGFTQKTKSLEKVQTPKTISVNNRLLDQISKTNNTYFEFSELKLNIDKEIFISIKAINELRRRALDDFFNLIGTYYNNRKIIDLDYNITKLESNEANFICKVRTKEQLEAVMDSGIKEVYVVDHELLNFVREDIRAYYVEPRVVTSEVNVNFRMVHERLKCFNSEPTSTYLNVTNALAVNLLENLGARSVGLSLELSIDQIKELIKNYENLFKRKPNLELEVYGRYELMHLKYRLGLTNEELTGENELVDRKKFSFPLLLEGGYVKILNSKRVHLIDYLDELINLNVKPIINFTIESIDEVKTILDIYLNNKNHKITDVTIGHIKEGVI